MGETDGICIPGMFIWVCGDAEGEAEGICIPGMFMCVCGDADGEADGICIPGMFMCVCGDAEGEADGICMPGMFIPGILPILSFIAGFIVAFFFRDARLGFPIPGIVMPGMLPIWFLFAEFFCVGVFFLLDAAFRRRIPDIFIPGIFIPGILLMSCFLGVCFLRVAFLFFPDVAFEFALGFDLLIPGMLDISCCARTGRLATNRNAKTSTQTLILKRKLIALTFFIIPPRKLFRAKRSLSFWKDNCSRNKRFDFW